MEIDSLELRIESTSTSAVNGLDALSDSLAKLKTAVGKGTLKLGSISNQLKTLGDALSNIPVDGASKLSSLSDSLTKLKDIGNLKLSSTIGSRLNEIAFALSTLQGYDFAPIENLSTAFKSLSELGKSNLSSYINQLNKLPELIQQLNSVDITGFADRLNQLATALSPFATTLNTISSAFSKLPSKMKSVVTATNKIITANTKVSKSYTNVIVVVAKTIIRLETAARMIKSWVSTSINYTETLNLFTVALGEYAESAQEYANTVNNIMGIDIADWMNYEAVFMSLTTTFGIASDRAYTMSQNLTQLAYDLASLRNMKVDETMEKLEAGIAGELEPLRRLGVDLSEANLKAVALSLGIDKTYDSMTQAEKAQLRYVTIMKQTVSAQGDMARTLASPANQLRILQAQVAQCAKALGNVFIPMLNAVIPYVIAVVKVIKLLGDTIASLFGYESTEVDYSSLTSAASSVADSASDTGSGLSDATDAAKELKNNLLGIDELNVLSTDDTTTDTSTGSGAGTSGVSGSGSDFDFELPTYSFLSDISDKVNDLVDKIKSFLGLDEDIESWADLLDTNLGKVAIAAAGLGTAIGAWKLAEAIADIMGLSDVIAALTVGDYFSIAAGMILTLAGAALYLHGWIDALINGLDWKNLIEMIAGTAAVAEGLYLIFKPFSTTLAPFAAEIAVAVGAMGIFATGLEDIYDNGVNAVNIIATTGGLTAAVVALDKAFGSMASPLAAIVAPFVAFNGALQITVAAFYDIVENGISAENELLLLIGVIASITAGVILFTTACSVNPILAGALVITSILAALKTLADRISAAGEAAYQSTDDYKLMEEIIERSAETIERSHEAIDNMNESIKELDNVSNDFATASSLVDAIFDINENAEASYYDLEMMGVYVDMLNGMNIDGLSLSIDETTGRVIESREEVENLIESLQKEAEMEAINDLLVQTYKDQYQAMSDAEQALKDYDAASQALNETSEKLAECPWYDFKTRSELTAAQKEETEAVEAAQEAYSTAYDTYEQLGDTITFYTDKLVDMKLTQEEADESTDNFCEGILNIEDTLSSVTDNMPNHGADIANGLREGIDENTKESEYKSIWERLGDWFTGLFGISSPSTVFYDYGEDITDGLNNAISENGDSSEGIIGEWAENLKGWFSDKVNSTTWGQFAIDTIEGFKNKISGSNSDSKSSVTTWGTDIQSWFTNDGGINTTSFQNFANNIITGFKDEITNSYTTVITVISTWATEIYNEFNTTVTNVITSIETWFAELPSKIAVAIDFISQIIEWANNIYNQFYTSVTETILAIVEWFSELPEKIYTTIIEFTGKIIQWAADCIEVISEQIPPVVDTIVSYFTDLPTKLYDLGIDIWNGLINGLTDTFYTVTSAVSGFGENIINGLKDVLGIASPSTVFYEMGGYMVEGLNDSIEDGAVTSEEAMENWANSLSASFTNEINAEKWATYAEEIISAFAEGILSSYEEIESAITEWAENIQTTFTEVINETTFGNIADEIINAFKETISNDYVTVEDSITVWGSYVREWFTSDTYGSINTDTWDKYASDIIDAFKTRIRNSYTDTKDPTTTWATSLKNWFTDNSFGAINYETWDTYANNIITGFKERITSSYTDTESPMTTWASYVKKWFTDSSFGSVNNNTWQTFANNIITGFKTKISKSYTDTKSPMNTWGSNVITWFNYPDDSTSLTDSFYDIGVDIMNGLMDGLNSMASTVRRYFRKLAISFINAFEDEFDIGSPSKVFKEIGGFVIEGFNVGLKNTFNSTYLLLEDWVSDVSSYTPVLSFAVDTSNLSLYDANAIHASMVAQVNSNHNVSAEGISDAMEDFYKNYIEPTIKEMASDVKRQADKEESLTVKIGNKTITDAITKQQKANGYIFRK